MATYSNEALERKVKWYFHQAHQIPEARFPSDLVYSTGYFLYPDQFRNLIASILLECGAHEPNRPRVDDEVLAVLTFIEIVDKTFIFYGSYILNEPMTGEKSKIRVIVTYNHFLEILALAMKVENYFSPTELALIRSLGLLTRNY